MSKRTPSPNLTHPCPRPPYAVLFDLDGTLVDSAAVIAQSYNRGLQATGHRLLPTAEILAMLGPTLEELYARRIPKVDVPAACDAYRTAFAELYPVYVRPCPGAVEFLDELRAAGVKTGVVTNRGRHTDELLRQCDLLRRLDVVVAVPDGPYAPKPNPEMLYVAMDKLDAIPSETCYVGDSLADMRAGSAARLWNIGVMSLGLDSATLEAAGAHVVTRDLTVLPALVGVGPNAARAEVSSDADLESPAAPTLPSGEAEPLIRPPYMMRDTSGNGEEPAPPAAAPAAAAEAPGASGPVPQHGAPTAPGSPPGPVSPPPPPYAPPTGSLPEPEPKSAL